MRLGHLAAAVYVVLSLVDRASAIDIAVDTRVAYQTIEGFGAFDAVTSYLEGTTRCYRGESFYDSMLSDLGITMLREGMFEYGWRYPGRCRFVYGNAATWKRRADALGVPLRFIATSWSPPGPMKDNNTETGGGHLLPAYYDDYGRLLVDYVKKARDSLGVDIYAVSPQNESYFIEPYPSCRYDNAGEYQAMLRVTVAEVRTALPGLKVFGPEDMAGSGRSLQWANAIFGDQATAGLLDALAVHGYSDGVNPSDPGPSACDALSGVCRAAGKQLWMTECSGFTDDWSGGMYLARVMYSFLKYGRLSAWTYWSLTGSSDEDPAKARECILFKGTVGPRYHVSKHFFRFIRPGARMVECSLPDNQVLALAFQHTEQAAMTVVAINTASSPKSVRVTGAGVPGQWQVYQTVSGSSCRLLATFPSSDEISLPASSVTTLYAGPAGPGTVGMSGPRRSAASRSAGSAPDRSWSLDGRLNRRGQAAGSGAPEVRLVPAGPQGSLLRLCPYTR